MSETILKRNLAESVHALIKRTNLENLAHTAQALEDLANEVCDEQIKVVFAEAVAKTEAPSEPKSEIAALKAENEALRFAIIPAAVLQDALRYRWIAQYLPGDDESQDDALIASKTPDEIGKVIDAALAHAPSVHPR